MPRYARIKSGVFNGLIDLDQQPPDIPHKGIVWLPCSPVAKPSFDPESEKVTGPTYTINANDVTEVWTKSNLSAQEISDNKDAAIAGINGLHLPQRRLNLAFHNRIRALEGQGAHTMLQFLAYWKGLL